MRFVLWTSLAASLVACAPQVAIPAKSPQDEARTTQSHWKAVEPAKQKVPLVPEPAGVPAPDASCQAFVEHPGPTCNDAPAPGRDALAEALTEKTVGERDRRLSCLEASADLPPGLVRTLRAELAPPGCADTLALPYLEPRRPELDRRIEDTLIALATAGRLSRLVQKAPELAPPFDKARFMDFFQTTLKPWIVTQAQAIHELSLAGARLTPYAKGVVAVEAGLADMRFVSVVRQVPLPKEMSDDAEVREAYYGALDEALEPRKARGRDAALVGLRELANEGVVFAPRVSQARALLSEVYSGRRIDALDKLLLPSLPALLTDTTDRKLAALLPSFYSGILLKDSALDAPLLRALLERGLPQALATRLDPKQLDEASKNYLVRALLERGRCYFRAQDFAESARLSALDKPSPEQALYHALASTLQNGPRDASDLLLSGPALPAGTGQVAELDHLAGERSNPSAPLAAFDAAYLRSLVPPQNDPKFWDDLSKRFEAAGRGLHDPEQKKRAQAASAVAKDTEKALRSTEKPAGPPKKSAQ
ncbi:MAG TPA: hypothetical protein VGF76_10915 [Polyangiaceae bacterium]